ncbi:MAG: RNA degradosome polyphosphate kinase [Rhodospirillaceae bacterium]|jgi:polyphosphate kinase|nr:RNA degradosome polyphosphate kinase [Rhodospirillaceae bacterium]MBT6140276.1 RNA degradosome polyphosphate kinase [Rhodospirillaceae bacterium]
MSEHDVVPFPSVSTDDPARFSNRELSWLAFNNRVLDEAANPAYPLLERLRFITISSSNLDEFYMVRVAGLKGQVSAGIAEPSADGLTPSAQLVAISQAVTDLLERQQHYLHDLIDALAERDFGLVEACDLTADERIWLREHFIDHVFPVLTPLAVDPSHPFPFLANRGVCLAIELEHEKTGELLRALVPLPHQAGRYQRLPGPGTRFIPIEQVVLNNVDLLFANYKVVGHGLFRVLRDSAIEFDEEAEDLVRSFESALKQRRHGNVIRLTISRSMPENLRSVVIDEHAVAPEDTFAVESMVGVADLAQLIVTDRHDLMWPSFTPRRPDRIRAFGGDIFATVRAGDLVVHHPYETFDVVVDFLRQAAEDPSVIAIKQTLYRTVHDSPIVAALTDAAEAGKSVTAMVELKARFDEETNIGLARDLERAGVQVVYGFVDLKTHAKVSLVVRREGNGLRNYAHFGTGNYHPITARTYTDLSLFTCHPEICRDAGRLFNYMTGYATPHDLDQVAVSPVNLRQRLEGLIDTEIEHAKAGRPATIWAKLNSLVDPDMIDRLYAASRAGVHIELVVRGICCLRPGLPGLSENIRVHSIVGRFLEHARVVCFGNGRVLPSDEALVFISSADWMPRNLDRRVEHFVPIIEPRVRRIVLDGIMTANLVDERNSWKLEADGRHVRLPHDASAFSVHEHFLADSSPTSPPSAPPSGSRWTTDRNAAKA